MKRDYGINERNCERMLLTIGIQTNLDCRWSDIEEVFNSYRHNMFSYGPFFPLKGFVRVQRVVLPSNNVGGLIHILTRKLLNTRKAEKISIQEMAG